MRRLLAALALLCRITALPRPSSLPGPQAPRHSAERGTWPPDYWAVTRVVLLRVTALVRFLPSPLARQGERLALLGGQVDPGERAGPPDRSEVGSVDILRVVLW